MADRPIIFGFPHSPFVRKVLAVLQAKSIAYDNRQIFPQDPDPEFRAASPLGKIPALHWGDLRLADSSVISAYLERLVGERLSLGDIAVTSCFITLEIAGYRPDPGRYPDLDRYLQAIKADRCFEVLRARSLA